MYVGGIVAVIVILLAVLLLVGVLQPTPQIVGGMFLALAIGLLGPFVDRFGRPVA